MVPRCASAGRTLVMGRLHPRAPHKFVENVSWIKNGQSQRHKPSHVALYDLQSKRCEQEIELEPHGIGVAFSLLPVPMPETSPVEPAYNQSGRATSL